jgi:hypothetical protein
MKALRTLLVTSRFRFLTAVCAVSAVTACASEDQATHPIVPPPPPTAEPTPPAPPLPPEPPPPPPKPPMGEMQREGLGAAVVALNAHDAAKVASLYADNGVIRAAGLNEVTGRDEITKNMQEWFDTFSNVKIGFSHAWLVGDVVVAEWMLNGTYSGDLFGVKGKDQPIGHVGLSILWFDGDGKVKEEHRFGDLGAVMQQVTNKGGPALPSLPASVTMDPGTGSPEEAAHVDAAKAVYAAIEKKSEGDFLAKLTDDVEYEGHLGRVKGKAEAKKFFQALTHGFADAKFEVTSGWGVRDYAIVEYTLTGTNKAPLLGSPPTNRPITVHAVDVMKFVDGKVAHASTYSNGLELMTQLGTFKVTPPPASAPPAPPKAK